MHQLPAGLFLRFFESLNFIVGRDILAQSAEKYHGHHASQEENDHHRVHDGEVVDLVVRVALQVDVPALRPLHVGSFPFHVVRVHDLFTI